MTHQKPSLDDMLAKAKNHEDADKVGMYLLHDGVVRVDAKCKVREGEKDAPDVVGMTFRYDAEGLEQALEAALDYEGIYYVDAWLNDGYLEPGDDIMRVIVGGDIRDNVVDGLLALVKVIKTTLVEEIEHCEGGDL